MFLTSKQLDGSLFAEERSLAATGSPVAFQIVLTLLAFGGGALLIHFDQAILLGSGGVSTWIL